MSDSEGSHIEIINWDKHQHYKDRNPPWIKLYHGLIEDHEFMRLQPASRWLAVGLFLLAARNENRIPLDLDFLQWRLKLPNRPDLSPLEDAGFIRVVHDDSTDIASRKKNGRPEAETEGEGEAKQEWGTPSDWPPPGSLPKDDGRLTYPQEFEEVWDRRVPRDGKNPKKRGYRMYRKARRNGMERDQAEKALRVRKTEAKRKGDLGERHVEQFATFFGQDDLWRDYLRDDAIDAEDGQGMAGNITRGVM